MHEAAADKFESDFDELGDQARLLELQKGGDIILVRSGAGRISRLYQWMFRSLLRGHRGPNWHAIPSHALLVACPGLYLESVPKSGVRLVEAEQCRPGQFAFFRVLRHPDADNFSQEAFAEACEWHFGQSYNYKINMTWWRRKFHSHSYCSQLIASIYDRAGKTLRGKTANLTLPINLARLGYDSGWRDVTADYLEADSVLKRASGRAFLFETGRLVTRMKLQSGYELADARQLIHQVNGLAPMLRRRVRTHRLLARVSHKLASAYARAFIPASATAEQSLSPQPYVEVLLVQIKTLLKDEDIFAKANSWRMYDKKFQRAYERDKVDSAMTLCRHTLAFALASCGVAQTLVNGTEENFKRYRIRLLQATYLSSELVDRARQALPEALDAIAPRLEEKNRLATMWAASMVGFLSLAVLARQLIVENDLTLIRQSTAVSQLTSTGWIDFFNTLPEEDRSVILEICRSLTAQLINAAPDESFSAFAESEAPTAAADCRVDA